MPEGLEQVIQIFPDSTGKPVRLLQVTTLVNGVEQTAYMQVVAIADARGNVLLDFQDQQFQDQLLEELAQIRVLLAEIVR